MVLGFVLLIVRYCVARISERRQLHFHFHCVSFERCVLRLYAFNIISLSRVFYNETSDANSVLLNCSNLVRLKLSYLILRNIQRVLTSFLPLLFEINKYKKEGIGKF